MRVALGEDRDRIRGAALELAHRIVDIDPTFAPGWIWLAWAVRNTVQASPSRPEARSRLATIRGFAERAMQLAGGTPEWERHWIVGSYYTLIGDHARASSSCTAGGNTIAAEHADRRVRAQLAVAEDDLPLLAQLGER